MTQFIKLRLKKEFQTTLNFALFYLPIKVFQLNLHVYIEFARNPI